MRSLMGYDFIVCVCVKMINKVVESLPLSRRPVARFGVFHLREQKACTCLAWRLRRDYLHSVDSVFSFLFLSSFRMKF